MGTYIFEDAKYLLQNPSAKRALTHLRRKRKKVCFTRVSLMFIFYTKQAETGSHFYVPFSFLKPSRSIQDIICLMMREKRLILQDLKIPNSWISAPGPGSAYLQDLLTQAPGQHSSPVATISHLYALCKITVDEVASTGMPIGAERSEDGAEIFPCQWG